jgi:hypothetical protein
MNIILFATAFLCVFLLISYYINKRLINRLDLKKRVKNYLKVFLLINFLGIIGYIFTRYYPNVPNLVFFLLSLSIGVLFLLFCTALIYDLSLSTLNKLPLSQKRRNFFKKTLDISSLILAFGLSAEALREASVIKLERVNINLKNLKKSYKIIQLSDIHIGGLIDKKFIHELVERSNRLQPDLVVITGDLVDISLQHAKPALNKLKNLKSTYGTFFVVGNHEYFHGVDKIISEVKSLGIRVLENENVYIGEDKKGFNLAGVYDVMGYRTLHHLPDLNKALKNKKDAPTILLAHQPRYINEVKNVDLMLSGHTHGGQLYPFKFLVKIVQPYIKGLHQHTKNLQIYVNKGTGFWGPPMRLGASSEITLITIS